MSDGPSLLAERRQDSCFEIPVPSSEREFQVYGRLFLRHNWPVFPGGPAQAFLEPKATLP